MTGSIIYSFFSDDELLRITDRIKTAEKTTAGEICVSIKERRSFLKKRKSISQLAQEEFFRLGINKTRDKTGILIYILLKEHQFHILADEGINAKVDPNTWNSLKNMMQEKFMRGEYTKGVLAAVEAAGKILSEHFPIKPDDRDELSNRVITK
ncbi:MAG TPA: TPM domain-containing protein [Ignavibacteriaceae bacterium]|nr:TPM domain-containing protein [Ignavibacteriaceae bacterium]